MAQDPECAISGIVDLCSAGGTYTLPYGGIIVCGLDQNWDWITFPLSIINIDNESPTAQFTHSFLVREFLTESTTFSSPLFVCAENAATEDSSSNRGFDTDTEIHLTGCIERKLSTCITDSFSREVISELDQFMDQLLFIETYYNTHPAKASQLPFPIPKKSSTCEWRSYYRRLTAHFKNYPQYCYEDDKEFLKHIPNFAEIEGMLYVLEKFKTFFDKLEVDGATSHLILLLYFILDYQLYKVIVDVDKESASSMVEKYCRNFHDIIQEKLWPCCGSPLAVTAAFLTGVDISAKIEDMVMSVAQKKRTADIDKWANEWFTFTKTVVPTVISFMKDLNLPEVCGEVARTAERKPRSDFDILFDPPPKKARKFEGPVRNKCLQDEIGIFQKLREPNSQPLDYWKNENRFPLLKAAAKIVLAVPSSSAAIERMFHAAGLSLDKLQKRTLHTLVINSLFIRLASSMKMKERVQEMPGITELFEVVVEQEIENLLNEQSDSDIE